MEVIIIFVYIKAFYWGKAFLYYKHLFKAQGEVKIKVNLIKNKRQILSYSLFILKFPNLLFVMFIVSVMTPEWLGYGTQEQLV